MLTVLFGIALNRASVFTVVLAFGLTRWVELVVVLVLARLPALPTSVPSRVPVVVFVDCVADVVWFVVALGLIVTLLFGIALNLASVFTVVLPLGVTA